MRILRLLVPVLVVALAPSSVSVGSSPPPPDVSPSPSPVASPGAVDAAAIPTWTRLASEGPGPREDHTLVVAPDGASAWLFGGRDGERALGDLWRLDLVTDGWTRIERADAWPGKRFGHTGTWVPGVGLVVFGGQAGQRFFDDLWAYDPLTGAWTELAGGGRRPEARYGSCAALGPDGRLWISHGFTAEGRFGDTRAWDPATGRWSDETPRAADGPVIRCLHDCLWTADGRLLLYGGQTTGTPSLGDAWTLDPIAGRWSPAPDPAPGARRLYALAVTADHAWLFGGADAQDRPLGDLWMADLATLTWTQLPRPTEADWPAPRSGAALIVDALRGRLLLFGGEGREGRSADLWQLTAAPG